MAPISYDSPQLRDALRAWTKAQPEMGGFTAYYHRLVRLIDDEPEMDILEALDEAHAAAMREVPTLIESIEMAAYAASSYLQGYVDALRDSKEA